MLVGIPKHWRFAPLLMGSLQTVSNHLARTSTGHLAKCGDPVCPNSCAIDATSITSTVTVASFTDLAYDVGRDLFTPINCSDPVDYYSRVRFTDFTSLNHSIATDEITSPTTGCRGAEPKVQLLGDVEATSLDIFLTATPPGSPTEAKVVWTVWSIFGAYSVGTGVPVLTTPLEPTFVHTLAMKIKTLTTGTTYNSSGTSLPVNPPGVNAVDSVGDFFTLGFFQGGLQGEQIERPCASGTGAVATGVESLLAGSPNDGFYPHDTPTLYTNPPCHAGWTSYHGDPQYGADIGSGPTGQWVVT